MGKESKRRRPVRELKRLFKAKSDELNSMIKKAPKSLLDLEEVKARIREIDVIKKRVANVGKSYFQRRNIERKVTEARSRAEELRRKYDPNLREINRKFLERFPPETMLCCPNCKEPDRGNRMNGKPWCFKCQTPLSGKKPKGSKILKYKPPKNLTFISLEV